MAISENDGNLTASWSKGGTYGIGMPVTFAVIAVDPSQMGMYGPQPIEVSGISLDNINFMAGKDSGPPVPLTSGVDYAYTIDVRNVTVQNGPEGMEIPMWIVNMTGFSKPGDYQANIRVNTAKGSDIGSAWFTTSKYQVFLSYRGMETWPSVFAPNENLTINITACEFGEGCTPHNLSLNGTKIKSFWNQKTGNPIKPNSSLTWASCSGNNCTLTADLSQFQGTGRFSAELAINDTQGNSKEEGFEIELRSMTVSTPNIRDVWVDQITESADRELNIENDRDRCDNDRWVNWDQHTTQGDIQKGLNDENPYGIGLNNNTCSIGEPNKVCINNLNFTFGGGKPAGNLYGIANCLLNNGSMDSQGDPNACGGRIIYVVGNGTQLWFNLSNVPPENTSNVINMTGIVPKITGDTFNTGNRNWTVNASILIDCEGNCIYFTYTDTRLVHLCTPDCTDLAVAPKNTSLVYKTNVYCVNATAWPNNIVLPCAPMQQVYMVYNTTDLWISNSTNLTSATPKTDGQSLTGAFINAEQWRILDIGKDSDGSVNTNMMRVVLNWTYFVLDIGGDGTPAINVARKYIRNFGGAFCINQAGEWNQGNGTCDEPGQIPVFVVSNVTHLWFSDVPSVAGSQPKANGGTFQIAGEDWQVVNTSYSSDSQRFRVKFAGSICGGRSNESCQGPNCQQIRYNVTPPGNHSAIYHSYVRNLVENLENNNQWFIEQFGQPFNNSRPVYIYHNTTHVWLNSTPVFAGAGTQVGGVINDTYGGRWRVKSLSSKKVTLTGINVLANTGAWINTSLSRSGYMRITSMNEQQLGMWDKNTGQQLGVDIDGDGQINSTVYFAVSDNASSGIYDTFFFANTSNFSAAIPATANMSARAFGNGAMILLSIEPNGKRIRVYTNGTGDWGDLGEMKTGSVIKVPLLVLSPNGSYTVTNVSIRNIRREIGNSPPQMVSLSPPYPNVTNCNGLCEISLNLSALSLPQSGRYYFEITASRQGQADERMDEWKWPFVTMRTFLADSSGGEGGYVSGFMPLPLYIFDGERYGWMPDVRSQYIQRINRTFTAMFSNVEGGPTCPAFQRPASANQTAANWTMQMYDYWVYINQGNATKVWFKNGGNCNFSTIDASSLNGQVNLTFSNHTYMLYVLDVNVTNDQSKGVVVGLTGVDPSVVYPLRNESDTLSWRLMAVNISGNNYDVLLVNESAAPYPMCTIGSMQECAKAAYFDTDGNFSNSIGVFIHGNFTPDLYMARVGPGPWEGIVIGNMSRLNLSSTSAPGIGTRISGNATTSLYVKLEESAINLDLDRDGGKNKTFFMLAFDDRDDGLSQLTDNVVDDDANMTEDWWADDSGNYQDFYSSECGQIREQRNRLPWGSEWGNARFGEMQEDVMYEQQPEWEIVNFNNTDMLLRKQRWWFPPSQNMTFIVRVYGFDQNPIANANVSVEKLMLFTPFGASFLNASAGAYSAVPSMALTNQYGWALISLRNNTWQEGNYMAQIKIETAGNIERTYNWFTVSSVVPGGP